MKPLCIATTATRMATLQGLREKLAFPSELASTHQLRVGQAALETSSQLCVIDLSLLCCFSLHTPEKNPPRKPNSACQASCRLGLQGGYILQAFASRRSWVPKVRHEALNAECTTACRPPHASEEQISLTLQRCKPRPLPKSLSPRTEIPKESGRGVGLRGRCGAFMTLQQAEAHKTVQGCCAIQCLTPDLFGDKGLDDHPQTLILEGKQGDALDFRSGAKGSRV